MDEGRQLQIETNAWKTIAAECFATPIGDPGAATVFRTDKVSTHEMWADQICIEVPDKRSSERTGITMVVWDNSGHPNNHFGDCKVMSFVGASMLGASRIGHKESPKIQAKPRGRRSLKAIYEFHNGGVET